MRVLGFLKSACFYNPCDGLGTLLHKRDLKSPAFPQEALPPSGLPPLHSQSVRMEIRAHARIGFLFQADFSIHEEKKAVLILTFG